MAQLFGNKLRSLRRQHALSQATLAERLGLASQGYIADLEAGDEVPSLDLVARVARLFGVSVDYLLRDTMPIEADLAASTDVVVQIADLLEVTTDYLLHDFNRKQP